MGPVGSPVTTIILLPIEFNEPTHSFEGASLSSLCVSFSFGGYSYGIEASCNASPSWPSRSRDAISFPSPYFAFRSNCLSGLSPSYEGNFVRCAPYCCT